MIGYKIFNVDTMGNIKFLFHGVNGSRSVQPNKWVKANKKLGKDGSRSRTYMTGFHFFSREEDAKAWTGSMNGRKVFKIQAKNVRWKANSRQNSLLADEIKVLTR